MTKIKISLLDDSITLTNENESSIGVTEFDPSDLLAGALAKCTSHEVRRLALHKEYDLKELTVRVDLERDRETKTANFMVHLDLEGDLSENEIKKLHKAAKKSYVNRLLSNNINLEGDVHHNGQKINFE